MTRKVDQISRSLRNAVCNAETGNFGAAARAALDAIEAYRDVFDPRRQAFIYDTLPGLYDAIRACDPDRYAERVRQRNVSL